MTLDPADDRSAIMQVIEAETEAYLQRNYEAWQSYWLESPEIRRIQTHVRTGVTVTAGAEIRAQMKRITSGPFEWQPPWRFQRKNFNVVLSPEMAWVSYDQIGDMSEIPKACPGQYHEVKILQKVKGTWKISCVVSTQIHVNHVNAPLVEVDETGRLLWQNEAAKERLPHHPRLCARAGKLWAKEPEALNELQDAITWIAQMRAHHTPRVGEEAVTRVVALGQDDEGFAHVCWAMLRDGKLLVTFDDSERLSLQITTASEVYRLSETQEKLSRQLVDGQDLTTAALALDMSPNTAKTHLQRIYDKVGVRSQPALVRVLLSADRHDV
ncbi:nuclear transport factor 2 family protein [Roseibium porphyridii]|uniref:Nuclear transport factor 2 family protein n=1 Tax=Roseibium porphyridii TaxID=2866279 RepID=A0ABY8F173_9HYPH|nr:nuclear transport factor 2 family protein [Roseibium sp. KMA01]WFE89129.1 nuclear transport factor 2 family protein [Roseibium sp. KMA01]